MGRLVPTATLVRTFLGVPGDAILDQNRYVTIDGCVPHVCDAFHGMLWIDTRASSLELIFVAPDLVNENSSKSLSHLYLFASAKLDWTNIPGPLLQSLSRWKSHIEAGCFRGDAAFPHAADCPYHFVLATIVQPNGVNVDIDPSVLQLAATAEKKSGQ